MNRARPFIEARDFLLRHRTDYDTAYREFKWPVLDRFNWALDYFDPMARGNHAPALCIVDESGDETRLSFAEMSERSARVANHLRAPYHALGIHPRADAHQNAFLCAPGLGCSVPLQIAFQLAIHNVCGQQQGNLTQLRQFLLLPGGI